MKKLNSLLRSNRKFLPGIIVGAALLLAGSVAYAFSPHSPLMEQHGLASDNVAVRPTKASATPTPAPSMITPSEEPVLGVKTSGIVARPTSTQTSTAQKENGTSVTAQTNTGGASTQNTSPQAATTAPQQPTAAPVQQATAQTISVAVNAPDGSSSFSIEYSDGMNVCDVMQKAKDTGKIKSVTFDDSYMATLHSKYVSEINGFSNNWTFSVNGSSPLGCSLAQPKPNDSIVWKFG